MLNNNTTSSATAVMTLPAWEITSGPGQDSKKQMITIFAPKMTMAEEHTFTEVFYSARAGKLYHLRHEDGPNGESTEKKQAPAEEKAPEETVTNKAEKSESVKNNPTRTPSKGWKIALIIAIAAVCLGAAAATYFFPHVMIPLYYKAGATASAAAGNIAATAASIYAMLLAKLS